MTRRGKKRLIALAMALVALAGAAAGAYTLRTVQRARLVQTRLAEGLAAYEKGDYPGAMRGLGYAYSRKRADGPTILKLADARRRVPAENGAHLITALRLAQAAVDADPSALPAREMLLELCAEVGFLTELREQADAILASHPDHPGALAARVGALRSLGRRDEALAAAEAYAKAHPADLAALRALAGCMKEADRPDAEIAARLDEAAAALAPSAGLGVLRAIFALSMNEPDKARALALEAASVQTIPPQEMRELLSLLDQMPGAGRELADAADAALARSLAADPGEFTTVALERAWRLLDYRPVRPLLDGIAAAPDKASAAALGWSVLLLRDLGEPEAVAGALGALKAITTPEAEAWAALAVADQALRDGDPPKALAELRRSAALAGEAEIPPLALAFAQAEIGVGEARSAERTLIERASRPGWRVADVALARFYLNQQRHAEALAVLGADLGVLQTLGGARLAAEAAAGLAESPQASPTGERSALTVLEQIHTEIPDDAPIAACLARGYIAAGRPDDARRILGAIDPKDLPAPDAASLVAAILPLDAALAATFEQAGAVASQPAYIVELARRRADAGDVPAGRRLIEDAIDQAPEAERLRLRIVLALYLDRYQAEGARAALQTLAEANPTSVEAQRAFLDSRAAWGEHAGLAAAIERLKTLTGEDGTQWKVLEARRLLAFSPDEAGRARALRLLGEARAIDGSNPQVLFWLAEVHAAEGERGKAVEALQQAAATGPQGAFCYPRLVQLLQEQGRAEEAASALAAFSGVASPNAELRRARATLLLRQAMWDQAAADLTILADAGDRTALLELAGIHRLRGRTAEAQAAFDQLLADPAPSREAVIAASDFLASQGDWDQARTLLLAIPAPADAGEGARLYASLLERNGRTQEAEAVVVALLDAGIAANDEWLARFHLRQGEVDKAAAVIVAGLQKFPSSTDLAAAQALVTLQTGQPTAEQTLAALSSLGESSIARESPEQMQRLIEAMKYSVASPQDVDGFRQRLRDLTRSSPQFMPAWRLLVESHAQRGEGEAALLAAQEAMRLAPANPGGAEMTALVLESLGRPNEALAAGLEWKARDGRSLAARAAVARAFLALERPGQAVSEAAPALDQALERPAEAESRALLLAWGQAMARAGRADEAFTRLEPLARADAAFTRAVWLRIAAESVAPADACLRWFEVAEGAAGSDAALDLGIGWGLAVRRLPGLSEQGFARGEQHLRSAMAQATGSRQAAAMATLADLLTAKAAWLAGAGGDPAPARTEALDLLMGASRADPANAGYLLSAAGTAETLERYTQSADLYDAALKLDIPQPQRAAVQNNLAYMVFLSGAEGPALGRAAELVREAITATPSAGYFDTLGWVEFARGRFGESAEAFRRAVALEPGMVTGQVGLLAAEARSGADLAALRARADGLGNAGDLPEQIASIHAQTLAMLTDSSGRVPK